MARPSAHMNGGHNVAVRLTSATMQLATQAHTLLRVARPDNRVDDIYRDMYSELVSTLTAEVVSQGIDPTTIPPHPRSKAARLLREANAAADKPMPQGKIRPKRSPIRE